MKRRVVITGLGCVSPVGNTVASSWESLLNARSGVSTVSLFDASSFPSRIAGEVKKFEEDFPEVIQKFAHLGRNTWFAIAAGRQAVDESGIREADYAPERIGVYTGAGENGPDFYTMMSLITRSQGDEGFDTEKYTRLSLAELNPSRELSQEPSLVPAYLAGEFGFQGPNSNALTACAAAAQAIGESVKLIQAGHVDAMLTGGSSGMVHPSGMTSFCLLTTLSTRNDEPERASRPFDKERNGFILAEGAGMLMLEDYESARRRGARIYGEISGYGVTADAYRITDLHPEGRGAAGAIRMALDDAGLNPEQINYVNAHGTSTKANDSLETKSIRQVFGSAAESLPVSSTKSMTGHLVAASGAVEAVFSALALQNGAVPPTINYETPDPDCDLDYIPNQSRELPVSHVLSNSFGFGGQNVALVFSRI